MISLFRSLPHLDCVTLTAKRRWHSETMSSVRMAELNPSCGEGGWGVGGRATARPPLRFAVPKNRQSEKHAMYRTREDSIMKNIVGMTAVLAATSGMALATDFTAIYDSNTPSATVTVNGNNYSASHIRFEYTGSGSPAGKARGQFVGGAGDKFDTFCVELDQFVQGNERTYKIVSLKNAPDPAGGASNPSNPNPYGFAIASRIHQVVSQAIAANYINDDLSVNTASNQQLAGVQAAIWAAIYGYGNTSASNATVQGVIDALTDSGAFTTGGHVAGLRAAVSHNAQDMLYVVPLPPAAFAGLATLFGVAGVARLRRR